MAWLIADAHGGADPEADETLLALLDEAIAQHVDVYLLGDLFAVWLAADRFLTVFQNEVVQKLRKIRNNQKKVVFVVGNRDYLAEDQLGHTFTQIIEHEEVAYIGRRSTLLSHGDRINDKDRMYRLWHRLSRNELSSRLLRAMPHHFAHNLSTKLEEKFRNTNQAYKSGTLPMKHLERLSLRARDKGVEQVILGHFHADKTITAEGGVPVIIAPAWLDQRKILITDEKGQLTSVNPLKNH